MEEGVWRVFWGWTAQDDFYPNYQIWHLKCICSVILILASECVFKNESIGIPETWKYDRESMQKAQGVFARRQLRQRV